MAGKKRQKGKSKRLPQQVVLHLLDQFNRNDLRTWQNKANGLKEYHVSLFYHLEGLRKLYHDDLCDALRDSQFISLPLDEWTRIVDYQYSLSPLSAKGSLKTGGRFNIGSDLVPGKFPVFPSLYIAEDYETAYMEKFGAPSETTPSVFTGREFALRDPKSFSSVRVSGIVHNVFDLRQETNLKSFVNVIKTFSMPEELKTLAKSLGIPQPLLVTNTTGLMKSMFDINWRSWSMLFDIPANSQIFGRFLVDAGFEGVVYQSTKGVKNCLAIFLKNLAGADSFIELMDNSPKGVKHTRLDKITWNELF